MDDFMEMMMRERGLSTFLGSSGAVWLSVAYLAGMFAAAAFRPQNIASGSQFRTSFILFGLYLIVPPLVRELVVLSSVLDGLGSGSGIGVGGTVLIRVFEMLGTVLQALAIICGLASFRVGSEPDSNSRRPTVSVLADPGKRS